ncbi:hypothetical protein KEM55_007645 [Ascosphaera atra]|nr:hypothetical protein KEM55_007645 [Ascosphaera atra]
MSFGTTDVTSSGRDIRHSINFLLADNDRTNNGREEGFDVFSWYDHYEICRVYFLDIAQWNRDIQALCALMNIRLPYQNTTCPVRNVQSTDAGIIEGFSLLPYIRRLVATGMDTGSILEGFFGDAWALGIGHLHKQERYNYLFAAKAGDWMKCKAMYDISPFETIPFLRIVQGTDREELNQANERWGRWMLMQDWCIGPDTPEGYQAEM